MDDKDIDFIARYYSDDLFSPDAGWRKIKAVLGLRRKRYGIAAAVAAIITLSATAAIITYNMHDRMASSEVETVIVENDAMDINEKGVMVFDNADLTEVVEFIEAEYSVEIGNIPADADKYILTLRFEGTPYELIDAINEILGLQLTVTAK